MSTIYDPAGGYDLYLWKGRLAKTGRPLILGNHGAGGDYTTFKAAGYQRIVQPILEAGWDMATPSYGQAWGNSTVPIRAESAVARAVTRGSDATPVVLFGYSMGGLGAFSTAVRSATLDVAGIVAVAPVTDLDWFYTNNAGNQASIDAAYGGSYATNGNGFNPMEDYVDELSSIPTLIFYGGADTNVGATNPLTFADLIGATAVLTGAGDSHVSLWNNIDPGQILAFLRSL